MTEPMDVEIREDAQQRRTHIDPTAPAEIGETVETEEILGLHDRLLEQVGGAARIARSDHARADPLALSSN
jgi:hypothetical protein